MSTHNLMLNCHVIPEKDGTFTIEIKTVWENNSHQSECFTDGGYLSQEVAEAFMVIKANEIKKLMEAM